MTPSSSSRASYKRSSPRREAPPSSPPRRAPPHAPDRRLSCCGMIISPRAVVLVALAFVVVSPFAWTCLSREAGADAGAGAAVATDAYNVRVVNVYPHDPAAFTQGLLYVQNDTLYESTGLYHQSSVRKVHLQTGKVLELHEMDGSVFGEGLTLFGSRLFQVTWMTRTGYIYNPHNLNQVGRFSHQMQDGWGLATDGKVIFGSDGTSTLYQMNPSNFKVMKKVTVNYNGSEVHNLNELEFIKGEIWANVWLTDCIARISPLDGKVLGWILAHQLRESLVADGYNGIDVLNGIAWDNIKDRLFVTGKLWPKLYEIKLVSKNGMAKQQIKDLCDIRG